MTQKVSSSKTIKFLYSYGGKIVPRYTDGKLRYVGGFTRVLAVERSITCSELLVKFGESCGSSMDLKCKLPTEDLDVLVTVKSDEELRILIEEYERVSPDAKIRAVLFPSRSVKKVSQPSSPVSCFDFPSVSKPYAAAAAAAVATPFAQRNQIAPPLRSRFSPFIAYPTAAAARKHCCYEARHFYQAPHRNLIHQ